jgi:hypothetical protein
MWREDSFVLAEDFTHAPLDTISDHRFTNLSRNGDPQAMVGQIVLRNIQNKVRGMNSIPPLVDPQKLPSFLKALLFAKTKADLIHSRLTSCVPWPAFSSTANARNGSSSFPETHGSCVFFGYSADRSFSYFTLFKNRASYQLS